MVDKKRRKKAGLKTTGLEDEPFPDPAGSGLGETGRFCQRATAAAKGNAAGTVHHRGQEESFGLEPDAPSSQGVDDIASSQGPDYDAPDTLLSHDLDTIVLLVSSLSDIETLKRLETYAERLRLCIEEASRSTSERRSDNDRIRASLEGAYSDPQSLLNCNIFQVLLRAHGDLAMLNELKCFSARLTALVKKTNAILQISCSRKNQVRRPKIKIDPDVVIIDLEDDSDLEEEHPPVSSREEEEKSDNEIKAFEAMASGVAQGAKRKGPHNNEKQHVSLSARKSNALPNNNSNLEDDHPPDPRRKVRAVSTSEEETEPKKQINGIGAMTSGVAQGAKRKEPANNDNQRASLSSTNRKELPSNNSNLEDKHPPEHQKVKSVSSSEEETESNNQVNDGDGAMASGLAQGTKRKDPPNKGNRQASLSKRKRKDPPNNDSSTDGRSEKNKKQEASNKEVSDGNQSDELMEDVESKTRKQKNTAEALLGAVSKATVTVTFDKKEGSKLGCSLKSVNDKILITKVESVGLIANTELKVGMEIHSVNNVLIPKTLAGAAKMFMDAKGIVTVVAFKRSQGLPLKGLSSSATEGEDSADKGVDTTLASAKEETTEDDATVTVKGSLRRSGGRRKDPSTANSNSSNDNDNHEDEDNNSNNISQDDVGHVQDEDDDNEGDLEYPWENELCREVSDEVYAEAYDAPLKKTLQGDHRYWMLERTTNDRGFFCDNFLEENPLWPQKCSRPGCPKIFCSKTTKREPPLDGELYPVTKFRPVMMCKAAGHSDTRCSLAFCISCYERMAPKGEEPRPQRRRVQAGSDENGYSYCAYRR